MAAFKTIVVYGLLSLQFNSILAVPTGEPLNQLAVVQKRNDRNSAKPLVLDITGWEGIAEENCYAMLCLHGGERIWQRAVAANANDRHRRANGADYQPFHADQLESRHTAQISSETISAEEFPWASMELGGEGAVLMPATEAEQHSQGGHVGGAMTSQDVNRGDWFKITMNPPNKRGRYCAALHREPTPDTSVCDQDPAQTLFGKAGVKLLAFAFVLERVGKPFGFRHVGRGGKRSVVVENAVETRTLQIEDAEDLI